MKLRNEFTVAVPLERAWETLLDIERVAGFLPGAKIEPGGAEGVYRGAMRVKLGPMVVNYQGTARLAEVDEQHRTADIAVEAREARGQGTASAVIRNQLTETGEGTRVVAETDLNVTGRQAQFGRGIMQDIASRMLGQFAQRFEADLLADERPGAPPGAGPSRTPSATEEHLRPAGAAEESPPERPVGRPAEDEALDLGNVLGQTAAVRYGGAAVAAVTAAALVALAVRRRGRRGIAVDVSYSW